MNRVEVAVSPSSPNDQEMLLLGTLNSLLDAAMSSLSDGEANALLDASRRIRATAEDLMALSVQLSRSPGTAEAQPDRQKLLAELSQQRVFCRAMLRRWRRRLVLRQQLLSLQSAPLTYTESLTSEWS